MRLWVRLIDRIGPVLALLAALALTTGFSFWFGSLFEGHLKPTACATACATEDSPCWDCHTMGNKICGPIPASPDMRP